MLPFRYTVNGYRGCSHACRYCFARPTHEYLEMDCGADFDTQVVVKTNVAEVLRRELHRKSWRRETVALGTNTDPYQRAEGRYALMPGIIGALADSGTPFSILTKGTLLRRDLPLIVERPRRSMSAWRCRLPSAIPSCTSEVEPGTPSPQARLGLIAAIRDAGLDCHVMVAPVLPGLTDSVEHLDDLLGQIAAAGATQRDGVRAASAWLDEGLVHVVAGATHPELVAEYRQLYRRGAYLPAEYRTCCATGAPLVHKYRLAPDRRSFRAAPQATGPTRDRRSWPATLF